ncbi:dTMP kinase [Paenibacillus paeoniae]|uniref:dTMP kinase n=1 Tax=Paenibacillus paeoniae TaxID=2292705 RepID=A0A371P7W4_9BACL|nr:dTMP kinase [Paenibacillus paeoniae]REK71610.1 dTMP kinase [Paenibacillus paeoniae]
MENIFLILEGIDGSGKTTIRKYIYRRLQEAALECLTIGQHSWTIPKYAEVINNIRNKNIIHTPEEIAEAFKLDKKVHYERTVRKHILERHVIADRFTYSDVVYNYVLWGIDVLNNYKAHIDSYNPQPNYIVFIDTPPDIAFNRIVKRKTNPKFWENTETLSSISQTYKKTFFDDPLPGLPPVIRIDNSGNEGWQKVVDDLVIGPIYNINNSQVHLER